MSEYRITCVIKCNSRKSSVPDARCKHITDIGSQHGSRWTVKEAYAAIDYGTSFYTFSPTTGRRAQVFKYRCDNCLVQTLRSRTDGIPDNNLDNLPECP